MSCFYFQCLNMYSSYWGNFYVIAGVLTLFRWPERYLARVLWRHRRASAQSRPRRGSGPLMTVLCREVCVYGGRGFAGDALLLLFISAAVWALFQNGFLSFAQKFVAEEDHQGCASSSSPVRSLHRLTSSNKGTFRRQFETLRSHIWAQKWPRPMRQRLKTF